MKAHLSALPLPPGALWRVLKGPDAMPLLNAPALAAQRWQQWDTHGRCQPGLVFAYNGIMATALNVNFAGCHEPADHMALAVGAVAQRGDMRAVWAMPASLARALATAWLGVVDEPNLPRAATATEVACGVWWLAALSDAMGWAASFEPAAAASQTATQAVTDTATDTQWVAINWSIDLPGAASAMVHTIRVALPAATAPQAVASSTRPVWRAVAISYPVSVASGTLRGAERQRLAVGSYIVGLARHEPRLIVGDVSWALASCHGAPATFRVTSELACMKQDEATATALLAHGRTPLSVVIGHAALSFDQLAALAPGSTIELGRQPSPQAVLYLGGTPIADVELVDADGQLAARVIALRIQLDPPPGTPESP